jgi:hypothetical protein
VTPTPSPVVPQRVQLRRTKGWRMPDGTTKVDRTTRWGNPFDAASCGSIGQAVRCHEAWLLGTAMPAGCPVVPNVAPTVAEIRAALRGRHLACWCANGTPCHADLLLRLANS